MNNKKQTEKILNGVMEQEEFVTLEVKFLEDNSLMTDLNLITLRNHIKEHMKEAISLAFAEKDAQKDLFIKKLKEEILGLADPQIQEEVIDKLNKEVFEDG
jgi:hypothetical protein